MPSIKDIKKIKLNDEFVYFGPESIVSEIADSMDLKNIGAVPILDDQKILLGVVSERDICLLYTSPSPRDRQKSRMPSSA